MFFVVVLVGSTSTLSRQIVRADFTYNTERKKTKREVSVMWWLSGGVGLEPNKTTGKGGCLFLFISST